MTTLARANASFPQFLWALVAAVLSALGGLATSRILYELFFPRLLFLGRPLPVFLFTALVAAGGARLWFFLATRSERPVHALLPFVPFLLNVAYLFDPAVDLIESRFLFCASLWLAALFGRSRILRDTASRKIRGLQGIGLILLALGPVYLLTMGRTVGRADTFEFQVVAPQLGIAHPTGYPLYLLLAKLFTLLPIGSVAWRVNVATAVFGLAALCLLYLLLRHLRVDEVPAILAAVVLGLTPTFWGQSVEAEVYTLHTLIVAAALYLMVQILDEGPTTKDQGRSFILLFFVLGLGLTNHLTTFFLLPPAALAVFLAGRRIRWSWRFAAKVVLAFLLPLTLYAYLPLRWAAVNGEPMGLGRFAEWVTGSRFAGALQWQAWLSDPTRYEVVGRLLLAEWGWYGLAAAAVGFIFLLRARRPIAVVLLLTWSGYVFYCLNYYVPDLSVFLLPAHFVIAVCWSAPFTAETQRERRLFNEKLRVLRASAVSLIPLILAAPALVAAAGRWPTIDRSQANELVWWGRGVLNLPLDNNAAILADSEKIAPLYYLQQAEGVRPDLDILVLPDEAAYRAELDRRVAVGQTVYLARFLPGLAGAYHLRSAGPLTEVSTRPLAEPPPTATLSQIAVGPVHLLAYDVALESPFDPSAAALTLYWQANEALTDVLLVYVRWANDEGEDRPVLASGQHPANNYYPTNAWRPGEVVADFHEVPRPLVNQPQPFDLQVALAPPLTRPADLQWQTITGLTVQPASPTNPGILAHAQPLRAQLGPLFLTAIDAPSKMRPGRPLEVTLTGYGSGQIAPSLTLTPDNETIANSGNPVGHVSNVTPQPLALKPQPPTLWPFAINTNLPSGRYQLVAAAPGQAARCGWLARLTAGCVVGTVDVHGVTLPAGAINFDDQIALLNLELEETSLQPGGRLHVTLTWQALAPMTENYTVFLQVLDGRDQIAGQVDAWPLQGTAPTSQWRPGQIITDPYTIALKEDLPPGDYRLVVGWYLLSTLQRLPVLDEDGRPIDDKVVVPGLVR